MGVLLTVEDILKLEIDPEKELSSLSCLLMLSLKLSGLSAAPELEKTSEPELLCSTNQSADERTVPS